MFDIQFIEFDENNWKQKKVSFKRPVKSFWIFIFFKTKELIKIINIS